MAEEWKRPRKRAVIGASLEDLVQVAASLTWHVNRAWYKKLAGASSTLVIEKTDSADARQTVLENAVVGAGSTSGPMTEITNLRGSIFRSQDKLRGSDSGAVAMWLFVLAVIERPE